MILGLPSRTFFDCGFEAGMRKLSIVGALSIYMHPLIRGILAAICWKPSVYGKLNVVGT